MLIKLLCYSWSYGNKIPGGSWIIFDRGVQPAVFQTAGCTPISKDFSPSKKADLTVFRNFRKLGPIINFEKKSQLAKLRLS